jgi:hypothetical protein
VHFPASSVLPLPHLMSCTPTKSDLYFGNSFYTVTKEPVLCKLLMFHLLNLISVFRNLVLYPSNPPKSEALVPFL